MLSSHDRNKAPAESGPQCRKLRHLGDHPWLPIITLAAWHRAHGALMVQGAWLCWLHFLAPEGEMEPPPPHVLSYREEMQKLPASLYPERDPAFQISLELPEGSCTQKR